MKTEIEKRASKFIDETDMMQFSTMEIMVMFAEKELEAINYTPCCESDSEQYCECEKPTLGKSISRCGTCDEWFKPLKQQYYTQHRITLTKINYEKENNTKVATNV